MSAAVAEAGDCAVVPQVCRHCQKSFPRLCDLNKHSKSHSRPFKCSFRNCKYYDHGWPTAKELERHVNDKHSASPRTFPCHYASCTYESKRESNCKQHMEKKHGWTYVRSKSNGKRIPTHRPLPGVDSLPRLHANFGGIAESRSLLGTVTAQPSSISHFDADFVLFPDDAARRGNEDHEHGCGASEEDESEVLIPWASPTTRIQKNQSMLDMFSEAYGTAGKAAPSDCMIDPSLRHHGQLPGYETLVHGMSDMERPVKLEPTTTGTDRLLWDGGSGTGSTPADSPSDRRHSSAAYSSQLNTPHNQAFDFSGSPTKPGQMGWQASKLRRRGSDDDDHRPEKKLKPATAEDFSDCNMPDIFRWAHPQLYDRDKMEKYSPCHSSHRDISTLVRHLGRPAHRLKVSKDAISSFDIDDPNYPHPRVGVCRRCWRTWHDQSEFEHHEANPCDKVSKGKREKWDILYESLTPLVDVPMRQALSEEPVPALDNHPEEMGRSPSRQSGFFMASLWEEHIPTPSSMPPQADGYPQPPAPSVAPTGHALVPADEYMRLQRENEQLKQLLGANVQDTRMHGGPSHTPRGSHFTGGPGMSSHFGPLSADGIAAPSPRPATHGSSRNAQPPTRDNLILHMGSQPHQDVDVQGLMHEPKENLSRHNSGLSSSSKSTIHHVSNSPPQRLAEYQDAQDAQATKATPNRKQPTSIPDSGYASASNRHRHGSFGDVTHMPGRPRGHQRNSSSMSTLATTPQHHNTLWSPEIFGQDMQSSLLPIPQQHEHEQVNTFTQMLQEEQPAQQQQGQASQQGDASFDDLFNHQAYYAS